MAVIRGGLFKGAVVPEKAPLIRDPTSFSFLIPSFADAVFEGLGEVVADNCVGPVIVCSSALDTVLIDGEFDAPWSGALALSF